MIKRVNGETKMKHDLGKKEGREEDKRKQVKKR